MGGSGEVIRKEPVHPHGIHFDEGVVRTETCSMGPY